MFLAWSAPLSALRTEAGRVIHSDGRSASFGELVDAAARLPVPGDAPLKTPAQWRLLGKPLPRRDSRRVVLQGRPVGV